MSWDDIVTESTRNQTRHIQAAYVPPHLRINALHTANNNTSYGFPTESAQSSQRQPGRYGQTRGRGRGRGRGRARGARLGSPREAQHPIRIPIPIPNPFDKSENFESQEVTEEIINNGAINFDAYEDIPVEVTGSDIPPPVNTFAEIDLGECLNRNITRCKFVKPTPIQRYAIPIEVAGRDLMACAQTGSGKTAAFCFPIISAISKRYVQQVAGRCVQLACPTALILSPTRELSCQIHEEAKKFSYQTGVKIAVAYGGAPIVQQFRILERGVDILVATPGRLADMIERGRVSLRMVKYLALDEADRMLDMGFEPQIRKIVEKMDMPPPGKRQTMLFSATFPEEIQRLASDFLSNYIFLAVGRVGSSTDLISQKVEFVEDMNKRIFLMELLRAQRTNGTHGKHALTLVFVETKRGADALESWLSMNGFPATVIHGDKVQMERERALRSFKTGATPIMVATDVASRGLDIPHVAHVINFDFPKDIDDYVHRIGRTGRAGKSGLATAFFSDKNLPLAKALVELMQEAKQEVPSWLSECAERSSYSGGGRAKRYGGGKFGGQDFRSMQFGSENYGFQSSSYGNAYSYADTAIANYSAEYYAADSPNYFPPIATGHAYPVGAHGYGFGHEAIAASGWD